MSELYDDIAESAINPTSATDGWGSLEENANRFWYNTTTSIMFRHNGVNWIPYDTADGMAVSRTGIRLTSTNPIVPNLNLENAGGSLAINGSQVPVLGSAGQLSGPGITLTSTNPSVSDVNMENINGSLYVNGNPVSGGGGGIQTGTLKQMLSISKPSVGEQFLTCPSDLADSKLCYFNGETWQVCGETYQTKSGEVLPLGSIVETDLASPDRAIKAVSTGDKDVLGVVVFNEATKIGQNITVAYAGRWDILCQGGTYIQTLYIKTAITNGVGMAQNLLQGGVFARPLEITTAPAVSGGLVKCILFGVKR